MENKHQLQNVLSEFNSYQMYSIYNSWGIKKNCSSLQQHMIPLQLYALVLLCPLR